MAISTQLRQLFAIVAAFVVIVVVIVVVVVVVVIVVVIVVVVIVLFRAVLGKTCQSRSFDLSFACSLSH